MAIEQDGRSPTGRATHERSRVSPSPPTVGVPNAAALAEHWFTLILRTWRDVKCAARATGEPINAIADSIDMSRRRLSGILNGTVANVTMRELHNIARASGYRLRVVVEELPASADTRPEGGDSTKIEAPFTGGAVPHEDAADAHLGQSE